MVDIILFNKMISAPNLEKVLLCLAFIACYAGCGKLCVILYFISYFIECAIAFKGDNPPDNFRDVFAVEIMMRHVPEVFAIEMMMTHVS